MSATAQRIMAEIEAHQREEAEQRTQTHQRYRAALLQAADGKDTSAQLIELLAELGEPPERARADLAKAERYLADLELAAQVEANEQERADAEAEAQAAREHCETEHARILARLKAAEQRQRETLHAADKARAARQRVEQAHHKGDAFRALCEARSRADGARKRAWQLRHCADSTSSGADARGHLFGYRIEPKRELELARKRLAAVEAKIGKLFPEAEKLRNARAQVAKIEEHAALYADPEARLEEAAQLDRQAKQADEEAAQLWRELVAQVPEGLLD